MDFGGSVTQENRISVRKANKVLLEELSVRSVYYNFQTMLSKANQITVQVMYWYSIWIQQIILDWITFYKYCESLGQ